MKVVYFFIILILCMFAMVAIVLIQQPTPLKDALTPHEQAIAWITLDRDIHTSFLAVPEQPEYAYPYVNTGNHKFHQEWINNFNEILKYLNGEPSKYNKEECIEVLRKAQATHAGVVSCDYYVLQWNYEWFERYDKIINYIKTK